MASKYLLLVLVVLALSLWPSQPAEASFYNERHYSYCVYNWIDECPDEFDPLGKGEVEEDDEIDVIRADADQDDRQEEAADQDRDKSNGYEAFNDPDTSSEQFAAIDGDGDGKIDFLLLSFELNIVAHYWDPDNGVIGSVTILDIDDDGSDEYLIDSNGNGELDAYYDYEEDRVYRISINSSQLDTDQDNNNEVAFNRDLDDSNGFEEYVDEDNSSSVYRSIDGDGDERIDFLISVDGSEFPLVYWDPDLNFAASVIAANTDDDEELEFVFDSDNDGLADKYYDRETDQVYDFVLPGERRFTPDGFGGFLYQGLGNWLRSLPAGVTQGLPFVGLWLLGILALMFLYQGRLELKRTAALKRFFEKEQEITYERDTFVGLISHYLRTPLTVLSGYSELLADTVSDDKKQTLEAVSKRVSQIHGLSESILEEVTKQTDTVSQQVQVKDPKTVYRRRILIYGIPFVLLGVTSAIIQFALADFRVISITTWWLAVLILGSLIITNTGMITLRTMQTRASEREEEEYIIEQKRVIDTTRQDFMKQASESLKSLVVSLAQQFAPLKGNQFYPKIQSATHDLETVVDKFELASGLKLFDSVSQEHQVFSLADLIEEKIAARQTKIDSKKLRVEFNKVQFPSIDSNKNYVGYIIGTILDNALKYSGDNQVVRIEGAFNEVDKSLTVSIKDEGSGIDQKKLNILFQPFSRAEGTDFTKQGVGLSLYLDRLIAKYLRGSVDIQSVPEKGTTTMLKLPIV